MPQRSAACWGDTLNNLNQLTNLGGNGQAIFEGTLDKAGTVTIGDSSTGITDENYHFRLMAPVTPGSNLLFITAIDAFGNTTNQHVQLTVSVNSSQTLIYDGNENLTSDGNKTYEWDAANRLVAINLYGNGQTHRAYDSGLGLRQAAAARRGWDQRSRLQAISRICPNL